MRNKFRYLSQRDFSVHQFSFALPFLVQQYLNNLNHHSKFCGRDVYVKMPPQTSWVLIFQLIMYCSISWYIFHLNTLVALVFARTLIFNFRISFQATHKWAHGFYVSLTCESATSLICQHNSANIICRLQKSSI